MLKRSMQFILWTFVLLFTFSPLANAESRADALFRSPNNPVAGNPKGNVSIVEFFDYQCSHCVAMSPIVTAIIKANPDVRVVFKEFPILGDMSIIAARAALAVNQQNKAKYYSFNRALMTADRPLTLDMILAIAQKMGLNVAQLKTDMDSQTVSAQLKATFNEARQLGINGTPAFFFAKTKNPSDYQFILGDMTQSAMQTAIDKAKQ